MNLIEQLRNQIRGRQKADSDVLQAIAQGVKEDLSRKYLLFEFMMDLRPGGWGWKVELAAILKTAPNYYYGLVFKVIFDNNKCILLGAGGKVNELIQEFVYEDPDMFDQLYQAISQLPLVPK